MAPDYVSCPMTSGDLPLVRRWLQTPEVKRWWGSPDAQFALLRGALDDPDIDQFIVALGSQPFGYIQCYALNAWNQAFGAQPRGARGIDQFIGISDMIGRGYGSGLIRQFTNDLLKSGIPPHRD